MGRKDTEKNEAQVTPGRGRREVRVEARKVRKRDQIIKILIVVLLLLILIMAMAYGCAKFVNHAGRFTINLDPDAFSQRGISLASKKDFSDATVSLSADPVENMDNITKKWMLNKKGSSTFNSKDPSYNDYIDIHNKEGSHNGKNYIAYSFYIRNAGKETVDYSVTIDIESVTRGADEAIRLMLFKDGESTIYGKKPKNESLKNARFELEKEFVSNLRAVESVNKDFKPGAVSKYTVILWLEGEDPECVDNIMGGEVTLSMNFRVLDNDDQK